MNYSKKLAYHLLKDTFIGETIYPLNLLKEIHPEIYSFEIKKYIGREKLMCVRNPILNCLWNDVIQFTCLDPRLTLRAVKAYSPKIAGKMYKIFSLDLSKIDNLKACLFTPSENLIQHEHLDYQYEFFDLSHFENLSCVPEEQIERWKHNIENNNPVLLWSRTKHFFYKSPIDLSEGEISEFEV